MITNDWTELRGYNQRLVKAVKAILPLLNKIDSVVQWLNGEHILQIETIRELLKEKEEKK